MQSAFSLRVSAHPPANPLFSLGCLGPHMPRRVPFGKSSTSSKWTQNELFTSSRSFVICPATASDVWRRWLVHRLAALSAGPPLPYRPLAYAGGAVTWVPHIARLLLVEVEGRAPLAYA
eukprot:scaffold31346_cov45-Phaeocystis_antarctica.AAC.2